MSIDHEDEGVTGLPLWETHQGEESCQAEKKRKRIEKEKEELLASLSAGNYSAMRTKVAAILNLYPYCRNSDVALALKYWETFQPDIYNENGILPNDLFELERVQYIVRLRAKIQNEYGLFQADDEVRGHRKHIEKHMHKAVVQDTPPRRVTYVYADETGKNDDYVIVGAVWLLSGHSGFKLTQAILDWQRQSPWVQREIHFKKFGKLDMKPLAEYLQIINNNREFLSFKVITIKKAKTRRPIEEVIEKLHEHMLLRGTEHEIQTARIDLPREIEVTMDEEQSLDSFRLSEMQRRITAHYQRLHPNQLALTGIRTVSSRSSPLIQLADTVAGSINRRLNHKGDGNVKDQMADMVIEELGLVLDEGELPGLDATALFLL
ncbi:MAG: DUF3800 domain-containing protein [Syntrophales bacterium]|jgi:hypothetical protein